MNTFTYSRGFPLKDLHSLNKYEYFECDIKTHFQLFVVVIFGGYNDFKMFPNILNCLEFMVVSYSIVWMFTKISALFYWLFVVFAFGVRRYFGFRLACPLLLLYSLYRCAVRIKFDSLWYAFWSLGTDCWRCVWFLSSITLFIECCCCSGFPNSIPSVFLITNRNVSLPFFANDSTDFFGTTKQRCSLIMALISCASLKQISVNFTLRKPSFSSNSIMNFFASNFRPKR